MDNIEMIWHLTIFLVTLPLWGPYVVARLLHWV
jgi:hypothetical protein